MWRRLECQFDRLCIYHHHAQPGGQRAAQSQRAGATPAPGQATIGIGKTSLGEILVDSSGRTVDLFEADKGTTSSCYDQCATFWPPLTSTGNAITATGAMASLIGSMARTDGTRQVTYKGHPLYYFVADKSSGDTEGQGVNNFGGGWHVATAAGNKIALHDRR